MKLRILPALAALVAAITRPFRRKPKAPKVYQSPSLPTRDRPVGPSLKGNGKVSRAMRKARRQNIARSFTRLIAHRPMAVGLVDERGAAWRKVMDAFVARWDAQGKKPVRLGRRGQKRSARLARKREVRELKKVKKALRVDSIALTLALGACLVGQ